MPRALRAFALTGWPPALALGLLTVAVLLRYDVTPGDIVRFGAYVGLAVALPGMLWTRFLRGRSAHVAEDLALGLLVGVCLEIATYLVARAIGLPLLFLVWPIATLVTFAVVPGLRPLWRSDAERPPAWWSWSLVVMLALVLVGSTAAFFAQHPLAGGGLVYVDMPYHLALVGELRNHVPPAIPYVADVPLAYHWFFYADAAATSWATGIEALTLLFRLSLLPLFAVFVLLTAWSARRLTGGWWSGPVAVGIALFGTIASPYGWTVAPVFDTQTLDVTWISPTNLFGLAIFSGALLLFIDALRSGADLHRRDWLLIGLVVAGSSGAKATVLPLLIAGLVTVLVGVGVSQRRLDRTAATGVAIAGVAFAIAIVALFRGSTGGLAIGPQALRVLPVLRATGIPLSGIEQVTVAAAGLLAGLVLWTLLWAGAAGLIGGRRWLEPRVLLLLGVAAAGLGAALLLDYPGGSQKYYLKDAGGAFGLLAATGIASLVPSRARRGATIASVALAAVAGAAVVTVIRRLGSSAPPSLVREGVLRDVAGILVPVTALVLAVGIAAAVVWLARRRWPGVPMLLLLVAFAMGMSVPAVIRASAHTPPGRGSYSDIPADGIAAARWLRDHSQPDDVVATNLHCRPPQDYSLGCDARHFWVSGFAERRMAVEGWAYTTPAIERGAQLNVNDRTIAFWDPARLAANDAAFTTPTELALADLRDRQGVRWLFADVRMADAARLSQLADLREQVGDFAVYELRATGSTSAGARLNASSGRGAVW